MTHMNSRKLARLALAGLLTALAVPAVAAVPLVDQTVPTPLGSIHLVAADTDTGQVAGLDAALATPPLPVPVGASAIAHANAGLGGADASADAQPSVGIPMPPVQTAVHANPMQQIASFFGHLFG